MQIKTPSLVDTSAYNDAVTYYYEIYVVPEYEWFRLPDSGPCGFKESGLDDCFDNQFSKYKVASS